MREFVEIEIDYASEVDISMRVSLRIKSQDDAVAVKFDKTLKSFTQTDLILKDK